MPFPMVKLGYMLIKQTSKPLARVIKNKAKTSNFLRRYILLPPAQAYHRWDTKFKMQLLGLKTTQVKPMSEEMAIDLAADMLGETVILGVGVFVLWLEYYRQSKKDDKKEDTQNDRLGELENQVNSLTDKIESQTNEIGLLRTFLEQFEVPDKIKNPSTGTVLEVAGTHHRITK